MRNGKLVKFVASGLTEIDLDSQYQQKIKDICIQLLRNAVVHGIEPPRDRELSDCEPVGTRGRAELWGDLGDYCFTCLHEYEY